MQYPLDIALRLACQSASSGIVVAEISDSISISLGTSTDRSSMIAISLLVTIAREPISEYSQPCRRNRGLPRDRRAFTLLVTITSLLTTGPDQNDQQRRHPAALISATTANYRRRNFAAETRRGKHGTALLRGVRTARSGGSFDRNRAQQKLTLLLPPSPLPAPDDIAIALGCPFFIAFASS